MCVLVRGCLKKSREAKGTPKLSFEKKETKILAFLGGNFVSEKGIFLVVDVKVDDQPSAKCLKALGLDSPPRLWRFLKRVLASAMCRIASEDVSSLSQLGLSSMPSFRGTVASPTLITVFANVDPAAVATTRLALGHRFLTSVPLAQPFRFLLFTQKVKAVFRTESVFRTQYFGQKLL